MELAADRVQWRASILVMFNLRDIQCAAEKRVIMKTITQALYFGKYSA
jgi:hypothetical protein